MLLLAVAAACGPNAQQKALRASLTSLDAARDGFLSWDREHQENIIKDTKAEGGTREDAERRLADYRRSLNAVDAAFAMAYSALAAAALDPSLAGVMAAAVDVKKVYEAIKALTGG